jgi:hypothetical protein
MRVVCIFKLSKKNDGLYAAQFEGEEKNNAGELQHAFSKLRAEWADPDWFRSFFLKFKQDYFKFYGPSKLSRLVIEALNLADDLMEELVEHAISGDLNSLFHPLDNREADQIYELQKLKAKGAERKSYLRIYAVKYGDEFVITGGTIKLTEYMGDRPHTKVEINKLDAVVEFLRKNDIKGQIVYVDK